MLLVVGSVSFVVVVVVVVVVVDTSVMSIVVSPVQLVPSVAAVVVLSLLVVVAVVVGRVTNDAVLVSPSLRLSRMSWTTRPTIAAPAVLTSWFSVSTFAPLTASRLTILSPTTC